MKMKFSRLLSATHGIIGSDPLDRIGGKTSNLFYEDFSRRYGALLHGAIFVFDPDVFRDVWDEIDWRFSAVVCR